MGLIAIQDKSFGFPTLRRALNLKEYTLVKVFPPLRFNFQKFSNFEHHSVTAQDETDTLMFNVAKATREQKQNEQFKGTKPH